jgi:beta-barrel assembly-enhancing protease
MDSVRRNLLLGGLACGCAYSHGALGIELPTSLPPLVGSNYQPVDVDERGLWQSLERLEENIANSSSLLDAPDLSAYTADVIGRLMDRPSTDLRVYIVHEASFNASMTPNGMMIVHTGFIARARSEAQYAAVLGHEMGHYYRKHSIQSMRDARTKSAVAAFVAAGANVAGGVSALQGGSASSWIDVASVINMNMAASIFQFSRELETEADAYGISLVAKAGYAPEAASEIWSQLIEERRRSAALRDKRFKPSRMEAFSTHPPEETRMKNLLDTANGLRAFHTMRTFEDGKERWQSAIRPYQQLLLDEQVKLNDPGASLYLIESQASDGWTGLLRYEEGEIYRLRSASGDRALAAQAYAASVAFDDAPAAAWRAHGYELLRSGRPDEGRRALGRYLELHPDAPDASMVRFTLNQ